MSGKARAYPLQSKDTLRRIDTYTYTYTHTHRVCCVVTLVTKAERGAGGVKGERDTCSWVVGNRGRIVLPDSLTRPGRDRVIL